MNEMYYTKYIPSYLMRSALHLEPYFNWAFESNFLRGGGGGGFNLTSPPPKISTPKEPIGTKFFVDVKTHVILHYYILCKLDTYIH